MSEGGFAGLKEARRSRSIGILLAAVLVLVAIVLASAEGGDSGARGVDRAPHLVSADELTALEGSVGHPVYWAGETRGDELELTVEASGNIYLRYLPSGVEVGSSRTRFLTVGTYTVADAVEALRRTAEKAGVSLGHAPGDGVVLVDPSSKGSVYLAYPGSDLQIEVYDPASGRALGLIRSGAIRPVG